MDDDRDVARVRQLTGLTMGPIQARNHLRQTAALARLPDPRWTAALPPTIPAPLMPEVAHSQQPGAPVAPTLRADACTACRQGRGNAGCACSAGIRLESIVEPTPWTRGDVWRAAAAVLLIVGSVVLLTGCGGGDASDDEIAEHDAQMSIQPVTCAASGCAR